MTKRTYMVGFATISLGSFLSFVAFPNENIRTLKVLKVKPKVIKVIKPIPPKVVIKKQPIEPLISALISVESMGNDSAIGDINLREPSVGALQIRPIMVREVNRILKLKRSGYKFKRKDRFSRKKSIEMFMIWYEFHHKDSDYEKISRNWNGGPKGHRNSRTLHYWEKVQTELNQ